MMKDTAIGKTDSRILWIDFAKVFCIFFVVLAHWGVNIQLFNLIANFVMPVFIFISGYLEKNTRTLKETVIVGFKTIIIPYILLYGVAYVINFFIFLYYYINHPEWYPVRAIVQTFVQPILGMILGIPKDTAFSTMIMVPLWFLLALFFVKIIHKIILIAVEDNTLFYIFATVAVVVIMLLFNRIENRNNFRLPLCIDCALLSFPFFALGNIVKKLNKLPTKTDKGIGIAILHVVISLLYFAILYFISPYNGWNSIGDFMYGNSIFLFYFLGIVGILATFHLSSAYIYYSGFVTVLANGTILIMGIHQKLIYFIQVIAAMLGVKTDLLFNGVASLLIVLVFFFPILFAQRFFPVIMGGKKVLPKSALRR